jgi:WD40 repeat protein
VVGRGRFGVVYRARDNLGRVVALKLLHDLDLEEEDRFRQEARIVAGLDHANVIKVHTWDKTKDGRLYLDMEFIPGGSLNSRLKSPQPAREAAGLVATLAEATHYMHGKGIVHRDLKPANVLLKPPDLLPAPAGDATDPGDLPLGLFTPKITDFGLAKDLRKRQHLTATGAVLGTPGYMAPEQAAGGGQDVGPAADVYALGAILYEALTGRPPFLGATALDTLAQILGHDPVPPTRLQPKVPRDLETICLKCLEKSPARRYPSAEELAKDLRRHLKGEPIQARPVGRLKRAGRWCRRHRLVAGLLAVAGILLLALVGALFGWGLAQQRAAQAAQDQERVQSRALLQQKLITLRSRPHLVGWSEQGKDLLQQFAAFGADSALRDRATFFLAGLDARVRADVPKFGPASSAAFDPEGTRMLLGGANDQEDRPQAPARLWDLATGKIHVSQQRGAGPVAFRRDGTPLQLVGREAQALLLWDVAGQRPVSECRFPAAADGRQGWRLRCNSFHDAVAALTEDGSLAAASLEGPGGQAVVAVWDGVSGQLLCRLPTRARALAFSPARPDGPRLLATCEGPGAVTVWAVPAGTWALTLAGQGGTVNCLAFSRGARLLAVGGADAVVTVWDLGREPALPLARCPSPNMIYALAFSPDGTTLASGGRRDVQLWDAATGTPLLMGGGMNFITGLAFAADGRHLAVTSLEPGGVRVRIQELKNGRGIRRLRGLAGPVAKVWLSPDGRLVAALATNWRLGVWEWKTGRLLHLLEGPEGFAPDNFDAAFRPDNRRLAACARREARLWDLDTGRQIDHWRLPPGVADTLVFHPTGPLLLFRAERPEGPDDEVGRDNTYVFRLRNLLGPAPHEPVCPDITEFTRFGYGAQAAPDGSCFVAAGTHDGPDGWRRTVRAYDSLTGRELWALRRRSDTGHPLRQLDPAGRFAACSLDASPRVTLVDLARGREVGFLEEDGTFGPGAKLLATQGPPDLQGIMRGEYVWRAGRRQAKILLDPDAARTCPSVFSRQGDLLAWGNADGSVSVCDLPRIRQELEALGLTWLGEGP